MSFHVSNLSQFAVRSLLAVALLLGIAGGSASLTAHSVSAADPADFEAASVTPADIANFVAFSTDLDSPQYLLAQELVARITGEDFDPADAQDSFGTMLPEEVEGLPELVDGQIAIAVQPTEFDLSLFEDLLEDDDILSSDLDDATGALDEVGIESLSGISFVLTAANIEEVGAYLDAELRSSALESGYSVGTVDNPDGSSILVIESPDDDVAIDVAVGIRAMAQLDSAIVLGSRVEDVRPFVQTAAGDIPALADDERYQMAMSQMPSDVLVGGYTAGLTFELLSLIQEGLNQASIPIALDLITKGTGPSAFSVYAAEEGFRFEMATLSGVGIPGTPFAEPSSVDLSLAERLPSDTMLFVSGTNLGNSTAMRAAEQLVLFLLMGQSEDDDVSFTPLTEQMIENQYRGLEMLLGFNAQTDLFRQLVGEFGFAVSSLDMTDPAGVGVLFVSQLDHPDAVDRTLTRLGRLLQLVGDDVPPIEEVTVGETTVNQITLISEGTSIDVQYGVVGDELLIGVGTALVDYVLVPTETLSENPLFLEASSLLPEPQNGLFYLDTPEVLNLGVMFSSLLMLDTFGEASTGAMMVDVDSGIVDAAERCGEYSDQAAAQSAYDSDPITNFDLDFDFDGVACDDFFTDIATPEGSSVSATVTVDSLNVGALAAVSYLDGSTERVSGILVVPEAQ